MDHKSNKVETPQEVTEDVKDIKETHEEEVEDQGEGENLTPSKKPRSSVPISNIKSVFEAIDERTKDPDHKSKRVSANALHYMWKIIQKLVGDLTTACVSYARKETKNATLLLDHLRKGGLVEILYGDLRKHALEEAEKAISAFEKSEKGKRQRRELRAGLLIPVSKIESIIALHKESFKVSEIFQVSMTAVAEYIMAELFTFEIGRAHV